MKWRSRNTATHEDALQHSRSVMKRALSEIAFYSDDEEASKKALAALDAEHQAYVLGVIRSAGA